MSEIAGTLAYGVTLSAGGTAAAAPIYPNPLTVTSTGTIAAGSEIGVYGSVGYAAGWRVSNDGTILSGGTAGVRFGSVGSITNAGTVAGYNYGVDLEAGGTVTNAGTASVIEATGHHGAYVTGDAGSVLNDGTIAGAVDGVVLQLGGTVANTDTASVIAGATNMGVYVGGTVGTVTNLGTITGGLDGVDLRTGGIVSNNGAPSTITGTENHGVYVGGSAGTVTNDGTIAGLVDGVLLQSGGAVFNTGAASAITGTGNHGVYVGGSAGTVTNAGTIAGFGDGVLLQGGGTVANTGVASAITGKGNIGVYVSGGPGTVTNKGAISGNLDGVALMEGGVVANTGAAGTITGTTNIGVYVGGGAGTVTNSGTISGGTDAIAFGGSSDDRVILQPGAVENGLVVGGSATNTLELASPSGTVPATGTLSNFASFQNFGTVAVDAGASWDLEAGNTIGTGVMLTDAGTLTNDGSIGSTVTLLAGADTFTNTGAVAGNWSGDGVVAANAVAVSNTGTIMGGRNGVGLGGGGTVINTGSVAGGNYGVYLEAGGTVTNTGTASAITAWNGKGIVVAGGAGTVTNAGTVAGGNHGVYLKAGGTVTNTGSVAGGNAGVYLEAGGTVTNTGTASAITAWHGNGIALQAGGSVTNAGTVFGSSVGVSGGNQIGSISSARTTFSAPRVLSDAALSVNNTGSISGNSAGIAALGQVGTVVNSGTISGSNYGVTFSAGGTVSNAAGGTIAKTGRFNPGLGVDISGGAGTVVNSGTISGVKYAIRFSGAYDDRVILDAGAVLNGAVRGGYGNNALELAAGTAGTPGTVTNFDAVFQNFGTIQVDGGASWALVGSDDMMAATIALAGTLTNTESGNLTLWGPVTGAGTLAQNAATTLTLANENDGFSGTVALDLGTLDVAALNGAGTGTIAFGAGPAALDIETAALTGAGTATASFGNTISGFDSNELVDVRGIGTATASFDYATDVLTLTGAGGATTTLQFTGGYAGDIFAASADGAGGTNVTLSGAARPVITGTHATATTAEAPVTPFGGVTVDDANPGGTDTLTVALSGAGGTLKDGAGYGGLVANADSTYTLKGSAAAVTGELHALVFTPNAGTTSFRLTDVTGYGTSTTDGGTSVTDTAAAPPTGTAPLTGTGRTPAPISAPAPLQLVAPAPLQPVAPAPGPGAVSFDDLLSYYRGAFTLTGQVSAPAGVSAVEVTAQVDGVATDLGAATVKADGTFTFSDEIGAHTQGFITATATDGAGRTASGTADFSLTGGLNVSDPGRAPFVAEQDLYSADGAATTAVSQFRDDGSAGRGASRRTDILVPGQTFVSDRFDDYKNNGTPSTTFVFDAGHGLDTISLFRVDGADHDTLSFKGADFGNSIAELLHDTVQTRGGSSLILDPTTGDTVKLVGITKKELTTFAGQDIAFHA